MSDISKKQFVLVALAVPLLIIGVVGSWIYSPFETLSSTPTATPTSRPEPVGQSFDPPPTNTPTPPISHTPTPPKRVQDITF
jgi:hypothetical protein